MTFIKSQLFLAAMGISYLYELKVLYKRFADIYTVDNVVMRKIDEKTKQPVPQGYNTTNHVDQTMCAIS